MESTAHSNRLPIKSICSFTSNISSFASHVSWKAHSMYIGGEYKEPDDLSSASGECRRRRILEVPSCGVASKPFDPTLFGLLLGDLEKAFADNDYEMMPRILESVVSEISQNPQQSVDMFLRSPLLRHFEDTLQLCIDSPASLAWVFRLATALGANSPSFLHFFFENGYFASCVNLLSHEESALSAACGPLIEVLLAQRQVKGGDFKVKKLLSALSAAPYPARDTPLHYAKIVLHLITQFDLSEYHMQVVSLLSVLHENSVATACFASQYIMQCMVGLLRTNRELIHNEQFLDVLSSISMESSEMEFQKNDHVVLVPANKEYFLYQLLQMLLFFSVCFPEEAPFFISQAMTIDLIEVILNWASFESLASLLELFSFILSNPTHILSNLTKYIATSKNVSAIIAYCANGPFSTRASLSHFICALTERDPSSAFSILIDNDYFSIASYLLNDDSSNALFWYIMTIQIIGTRENPELMCHIIEQLAIIEQLNALKDSEDERIATIASDICSQFEPNE